MLFVDDAVEELLDSTDALDSEEILLMSTNELLITELLTTSELLAITSGALLTTTTGTLLTTTDAEEGAVSGAALEKTITDEDVTGATITLLLSTVITLLATTGAELAIDDAFLDDTATTDDFIPLVPFGGVELLPPPPQALSATVSDKADIALSE